MLHAFLKLSYENRTRLLPLVLSIPIRFALQIHTRVNISVRGFIDALPRFEALHVLSFVSITIDPFILAKPPALVIAPIAFVKVTLDTSPDAVTIFGALNEVAIVDLPVEPSVNTFPMWLIA